LPPPDGVTVNGSDQQDIIDNDPLLFDDFWSMLSIDLN
jgi:hypothetical protein